MANLLKGELVTFGPAALVTMGPVDLVRAFLSGRTSTTLLAYKGDLQDFTTFLQASSLDDAARLLMSHGSGAANGLALAYRAHLLECGRAPKTINRRLSALRSLAKLGRVLGMIPWTLEVEGVKSIAYRDTRGCGTEGFRKMLDSLESGLDSKTVRDRAIIRLLYGMALRRGEVVSLDLSHVDLETGRLSIMGKGRTERESLSIPFKALDSLKAWIAVRGTEDGALFTSLDRAHFGHRLTGTSLYRLVSELGLAVGLVARPHGLRHAAITAALDATNGNTRAVQKFSRHRKLETLSLYDDSRADLGGQVAALIDLGA